jgi:hypothetical protein
MQLAGVTLLAKLHCPLIDHDLGMMEFFEEDQDNRIKKIVSHSSHWIALGGWALIGSALNIIIFSALPVKLTKPEWQLQLISAILSNSNFLLTDCGKICKWLPIYIFC